MHSATAPTEGYASNASLLKAFLLHLRLSGRTQTTQTSYRQFLERFLTSVGKPAQVTTTKDIRLFLMGEVDRGNSDSSIATKVAILKSFFKWLLVEECISRDPMLKVEKPKVRRKEPASLSYDELEALRETANGNLVDQLLVELLYSSGMRVSEAQGLNWTDIDWEHKEASIVGKGNKPGVVELSTRTIRLLRKYRATRTDEDPAVLYSRYKRRMSVATIQRRVRKLGKKAGIQQRVHPHLFRHTHAQHLLDAGAPLEVVSTSLRHSQISTTQIYAQVRRSALRQHHRVVFQ